MNNMQTNIKKSKIYLEYDKISRERTIKAQLNSNTNDRFIISKNSISLNNFNNTTNDE